MTSRRDLRATYWVWRRELHEMLRAPLVYGIGGVFLFVQGVAFAGLVGSLSDPQRAAPLGALIEGQLAGTLLTWVLQLVVLTLLGMRAIADDKRSGAWELLLTAQVGEGAAVVGKWLAASTMYALLWVPTLAYFGLVAAFRADGGGWDVATIVCGYAGAIAVGMALLAWAIAASAATRSTLAAGGLGFALLVAMFLVGELTSLWPELPVDHPTLAAALEAMSIRGAVLGFARGEIGAPALVLIGSLAVTGLSLAIALACAGRRRRRETRTRLGGTIAIATICVLLGAFASRHPLRADISANQRNTLDATTLDVLASLDGTAELTIVLPTLGGLEPIYDEIVRVTERMAEHAEIELRVVDPVNAPGGLDAIAKIAGVARTDLARGGSVVVDHRNRRRVLDLLALATIERGPGDAPKIERLAIEQAIAGALAALARERGITVCATASHGELPLTRAPNARDDNDWHLVGDRLRANGIAIEETTLEDGVDARCKVLIVAGPSVPFTAREALAIQEHVRAGGGLLVAAASRTLPKAATGLEGVLAAEGLGLPAAVAIDPQLTVREVPGALLVVDGYTEHYINRGFPRVRGTLWFQPRAVVASREQALVVTTAAGWGERDFEAQPAKQADDLGGPVPLAAIGSGAAKPGGARVIAIGSAESFNSSLLAGGGVANDLWLARAVRWLANAGDPNVDVAARAPSQVRLVLTASERSLIVTLSVAGIPLLWLVFGGAILAWRYRRRRLAGSPARGPEETA